MQVNQLSPPIKPSSFSNIYRLATNYHQVPIIAKQNSDKHNLTKGSIPNLSNKAKPLSK